MAEAVFAREQVKELSLIPTAAFLAAAFAELARLAKHFFVSHRPRDTRYRNRQQKEFEDLKAQLRHSIFGVPYYLATLRRLLCDSFAVMVFVNRRERRVLAEISRKKAILGHSIF